MESLLSPQDLADLAENGIALRHIARCPGTLSRVASRWLLLKIGSGTMIVTQLRELSLGGSIQDRGGHGEHGVPNFRAAIVYKTQSCEHVDQPSLAANVNWDSLEVPRSPAR